MISIRRSCFILGVITILGQSQYVVADPTLPPNPSGCDVRPWLCPSKETPLPPSNLDPGTNAGVPKPTEKEIVRENKAKLACKKLSTLQARQACLDELP